MIVVNTDGLCQPENPGGIAAYGWVAYQGEEKIGEGYEVVAEGPEATNNVAEYSGVIAALEWLLKNNFQNKEIILRSDSQLCIYQLQGQYRVKAPRIIPLYSKAVQLLAQFKNITLEWVPREENEEADMLSRKAKEEYEGKSETISQDKDIVIVASESKPDTHYTVDLKNKNCTCPYFTMQKRECKHIKMAEGDTLVVKRRYLEKIYNIFNAIEDPGFVDKNWADIEECKSLLEKTLSR